MQLGTDLVFRCPTVVVSRRLAARGTPVWQYQFDYAAPGGAVSHGSEIRYVFDRPAGGEPPLQSYWLNFVRSGDPNAAGLPHWPRYDVSARGYLSFEQTGPVAKADLRGDVCEGRAAP